MSEFEYNSSRETLIIPEYGRHIQKMIQFTKKIEDPKKRQVTAEAIINLMNQMVPQAKTVVDYEDKLWKHFFRIAEYEIDVVPTKGEVPAKAVTGPSLTHLPYPQSDLKYRHYGKYVMEMIAEASKLEDGPTKDGFIQIIAAYMKMAFKNWNRDHFVTDENIRTDLKHMSNGKLILGENVPLDFLGSTTPKRKKRPDRGSKRSSYKKKRR
ncbi:MAG: DUF4290 domain-containing protein [Saprospiraceae bacterium]|nr:DUF4290 domain-containing protein [Saprospiraceae bacterium]